MTISQKSIKVLWSAAGGRCAFPDCWERLCYHEAEDAAPYTLGEMAHICGEKPGANRHDPAQTPQVRDDYQNLILLCPTHHRLIDRRENEGVYTEAVLRSMKEAHEARVLASLEKSDDQTKLEIVRAIHMLLEENRQVWAQYGPQSDLARRQPYNEAVHTVWISERLSVIVPNNRKIASLLRKHQAEFALTEQEAVSAFLMHARSYEQWVGDEIPYEAVTRFPVEFDHLIRRTANGGE